MTHPFGDLSAQREQLGDALGRLRIAAGLSARQVGEQIGLSQSAVSRIEHGDYKKPIAVSVAEQWAKAAGASERDLAAVLDLAERAVTSGGPWRRAGSLARQQRASLQAESAAGTILSYQPAGLPGLLQTPEVAWHVFAAGRPAPTPEDIAAGVAGRMLRQTTILTDKGKRFEFINTEPSLREWAGEPALMRAQLDRLSAAAGQANVALYVIPRPPAWADHGFTILADRGEDGPMVHVELLTEPRNYEDPEVVGMYQDAFAALKASAVTGNDAVALIREVAASLGQ